MRGSTKVADLNPPLGTGGPCRIVDRILKERLRPDKADALISLVEGDQELSNHQADIFYDPIPERGPPPFDRFMLTPHSQYRMDLRGVTVKDLRESLARFRDYVSKLKQKNDPEYARIMQPGKSELVWTDPKSKLFFVFGLNSHTGSPTLVTTYWKGEENPSMPFGGCQSRQAGHSAPAGELFGIQTFVSEQPAKGIEDPLGDSIYHSPGESPRSDRERALPQRTDTKDNLTRKPPHPPVYNTPGPSEPGTKIKVRSPGVPGEEYGHPYKDNVYPRRTAGESPALSLDEVVELLKTSATIPSYSKRQHKQRGKAKRYTQQYYRKNKSKIKSRAKRRYKRFRNSPTFKRIQKFRKDPKYRNRYRRIPSGGVRSPKERSKKYRQASDNTSFYHPDFGWGDVVHVEVDRVFVHLDGGLECVPISLLEFIAGAIFDSEESTDAFYGALDQLESLEDELETLDELGYDVDLTPREVTANFYRETFTPGYNLDPGKGERNLGAPGPEDMGGLGFYANRHDDRAPGHKLEVREMDDVGGSAKVIPSGHGFVNKEASAVRVAKRLAEMLDGTSKEVIQKSVSIKPKGKRFDSKNSIFTFGVPGSKGENYSVRIKVLRKGNTTKLAKLHLLVSCSCNFWQWQGPEHWAKVEQYLYGKPRGTASKPDAKDPTSQHKLCKHVVACLNNVREWELSPAPSGKV